MEPLAPIGAVLAVVAAALVGLGRLARRSRAWSDEEYERRRGVHGSGLLAASMKALGEELGPGGKKVAEEREAVERGAYGETERSGEPPSR